MICYIRYIKGPFFVLGLLHEHQRPDRDDYVSLVNKGNAPWNVCPLHEQNIIKKSRDEVTGYGLGYDICSIMQYGQSMLPGNLSPLCNLTPKQKVSCYIKTPENTVPHITTLGQETGLSELDIRILKNRYQCKGSI